MPNTRQTLENTTPTIIVGIDWNELQILEAVTQRFHFRLERETAHNVRAILEDTEINLDLTGWISEGNDIPVHLEDEIEVAADGDRTGFTNLVVSLPVGCNPFKYENGRLIGTYSVYGE